MELKKVLTIVGLFFSSLLIYSFTAPVEAFNEAPVTTTWQDYKAKNSQ